MADTKSFREALSVEEVGDRFLEYYRHLGYDSILGSSLLDDSLPMSFVMSAGMVQFESMFGKRRGGDHFALIQNCFRYFDLDRIGESNVHLSLFQMPGAFDFGPVNRGRTISRIWDLLTNVYGFDPASLSVTYFIGGEVDGQTLPPDEEAALAWHNVGLSRERIVGLGAESNFWSQTRLAVGRANSRKRGPNTEVFYDRGEAYGCGVNCEPGCGCGRFVEFLNTLFITHQFDERLHRLIPMAEPFTEVVIGRERVACILQGKESVFEIDTIYPLIQQLRCFSKPLPVEIEGLDPVRFERILVDHLRALLFLTVDGAPPPGKGGRARLIRKLIRELLTSQRLLGISDPGFMRSMILTALEIYPQLALAQKRLLGYLSEERERFERTVQVGLYDLEAILQQNGGSINANDVFALENKHGLPLPLLRYRLWQKNIQIDRVETSNALPEAENSKTEFVPAMIRQSTTEIVKTFLHCFGELGYQVIPSSSLLDDSIPMSFVMSAGLVQVERSTRPLAGWENKRLVLLQNCFRHFDLDRIGKSSTHLSFFRMLGAFTFGPVVRLEQIRIAWHLATEIFHIPAEKLWVTYFGGDLIAGNRLEADMETYRSWCEVGMQKDHLLGMDAKSNFWRQSAMLMGMEHASKCGPNSEIFFDRGTHLRCGSDCQPGCSCGRFVEFLNMLFITHSFDGQSGKLELLENPFIESVVGLERLAMILQNADSVYEIDSIRPLMIKFRPLSKPVDLNNKNRIYFERILTDHLRALLFLTSDGAPSPGKGGRSFLMRRLMRELLVSMELLGINNLPCFSNLLDQAVSLYQESKPDIQNAKTILMQYYANEKLSLEHTLESGFSRIERVLDDQNIDWVSGQDILDFEKEYGLPLPLLERYLHEKHIAYNSKAIEAATELWKMDILEANIQSSRITARGMP